MLKDCHKNESSLVWGYKWTTFQEMGPWKSTKILKWVTGKCKGMHFTKWRRRVGFSLKGNYLLKMKLECYSLGIFLCTNPFLVHIWGTSRTVCLSSQLIDLNYTKSYYLNYLNSDFTMKRSCLKALHI